jgi:anti-sigma regulatory factor (Ser/Thr protein kinase)
MASRESIPDPLRLKLSGEGAVSIAVSSARVFASAAILDRASSARLAIVVEELVLNLYDHGELAADEFFELELQRIPDALRVSLIAPGPKFDPRVETRTSTPRSAGASAGLKLIREWSQSIEHDYVDGRNRVVTTLAVSTKV